MIKKFKMIKSIGRFSELHNDNGTEGDFSKLSIVYGKNACGKTTLCDVLRSLATDKTSYIMGRRRLGETKKPEVVIELEGTSNKTIRFQDDAWNNREICPPIYIYDDRFVAENVLIGHYIDIDQRRNLYGLVMGAHAIELKTQVDDAEENLKKTTDAFNSAEKLIKNLLPQGMTVDIFRNVPKIDDVTQQIQAVESELTSAKQMKEKADGLRQRKPLTLLSNPEIPADLTQVLSSTLDQAAFDAEQRIRAHLDATSKGLSVDWIKQGYKAQIGSKCPHCGQDMQGLDILSTYRAFFSGALQAQEELLDSTKNKINIIFGEAAQNRFRETRTAHKNEQIWWNDAAAYKFELPPLDDSVIVEIISNTHSILNGVLLRKQANRGNSIELTEEESLALDTWTKVAIKLQKYNSELKRINELLEQQKTGADSIDLIPIQKHLESLKLSKARYEQKVIDAYSDYETAQKAQEDAKRTKTKANTELRKESERFLSQYSERINELLKDFAVEFCIVDEGVKFKGGQPSGQLAIELCGTQISSDRDAALDPSQPSLANTLSGGDRSALALAFFLAMLELDLKLNESIVVFDDPYHNQDRSRQQCTIEKIHDIANIARQCFVLSHDPEFARSVNAMSKFKKLTRTFSLRPMESNITLKAEELPYLPSQAYYKHYCRLRNYIQKPESYIEHLEEVAGTIREILEEYFRIKFPLAWEENDWLGEMIKKIRDADQGSPLYSCQEFHEELSKINIYSQRYHHALRGEQADEPDAKELKVYVERTLHVIHS